MTRKIGETLGYVVAFGVPLAIMAWPFLSPAVVQAIAAVALVLPLGIAGYLAASLAYGFARGFRLGLGIARDSGRPGE